MTDMNFNSLDELVGKIRDDLQIARHVLIYAYNGTGKTRLSMAFKKAGKQGEARDTLYFNAYTEDLFTWDNDLEGDSQRVLKINEKSRFFAGIQELEMENRIRPFLHRYADIDFAIDYERWTISFSREVQVKTEDDTQVKAENIDNIKVSRGEENIFIWCFFMAIVQLAIDEAEAYNWVKYIFIDDPISSLDDNHVIAVATDLAQLLKHQSTIQGIVSSHHTLFFNVLWNELKRKKQSKRYFLGKNKESNKYILRDTGATPYFHHVAVLTELYKAGQTGKIYSYHFNMLRSVLEKTASFHGFPNFSSCVKQDSDDTDGIIHTRLINLLSHGNYSLYEPRELLEENKVYFRKILGDFIERYAFNPDLFPEEIEEIS